MAPHDPDDRLARVLHRGAAPERRPLPDHVVPLGRTLGLPMNGAVSNLSWSPEAIATLGKELRSGRFDVVHVHEPNAFAVVARLRSRPPACPRSAPSTPTRPAG